LERHKVSQFLLCTSSDVCTSSDGFAPRFGHFPLRVHVMFSAQNSEAQFWCNTLFPRSGDVAIDSASSQRQKLNCWPAAPPELRRMRAHPVLARYTCRARPLSRRRVLPELLAATRSHSLRLKHDYAAVANGMHQCPPCVISGLSSRHRSVSALHPKTDVHL